MSKIFTLFQFGLLKHVNIRNPFWKSLSGAFAPIAHLVSNDTKNRAGADMFVHEFAHCMVHVMKGNKHKLALQNFGWKLPSDEGGVGYFTDDTADNECIVTALQQLMTDYFNLVIDDNMFSFETMSSFVGYRNGKPSRAHSIPTRRTAEEYFAYMKELYDQYYGAKFIKLLDDTIECIAEIDREINKKVEYEIPSY